MGPEQQNLELTVCRFASKATYQQKLYRLLHSHFENFFICLLLHICYTFVQVVEQQ
jgi:hypothetical protein